MPVFQSGMRALIAWICWCGLGAAGALGVEPADGQPVDGGPVVLITAFTAFAGRGVNGSATVAAAMDGTVISGHRLHALVMPVVWGAPEAMLPAAIARWRPRLVLGMGEGGPGRVAVELVARNRADAIADEHGRQPAAAVLAPDGPDQRASRFSFAPEWFAGQAPAVIASTDAGGYLCNACLYAALRSAASRCGFVHLPPQEAVPDADYARRFMPVIIALIERNLAR
jgi:pyroglutamyl-peptidase